MALSNRCLRRSSASLVQHSGSTARGRITGDGGERGRMSREGGLAQGELGPGSQCWLLGLCGGVPRGHSGTNHVRGNAGVRSEGSGRGLPARRSVKGAHLDTCCSRTKGVRLDCGCGLGLLSGCPIVRVASPLLGAARACSALSGKRPSPAGCTLCLHCVVHQAACVFGGTIWWLGLVKA